MVAKRIFIGLALASVFACGQARNTPNPATRTDNKGNVAPVAQPVPGNSNIVAGDPNTNTPTDPNANAPADPNAAAGNPNAANPNAGDNPNHLVNFGKPDPLVVMDANAKAGFNPNDIYTGDDNGYPTCETPPQIDFGYTQVAGCPAPVGTQLPMQSYCHMDYNTTVTWYETNPPASGDHWPDPSHSLGVNPTPVPREYYVHSMEHGAVILAYNCPSGCDYELSVLRGVVAARADRAFKVLMTADPRMPANSFAAISWTWLYPFSVPDAAKLLCFIDQHYNHARENSLSL